jgi:heme/copper-type cytochrome/quinol oxidase subunit 2
MTCSCSSCILTGVIFVGTRIALFWFMWKYDADKNPGAGEVHARQPHAGSGVVDSPAATLLFIAIYQMNAWADAKMRRPAAGPPTASKDGRRHSQAEPLAEVTGRQFEWRLRYAGEDGEGIGTPDDMLHRQRPARSGQRRVVCRSKRGRAAQLLPAQPARQAGRGAGHEAVRLVPLPTRRRVRHRLRRAVRLGPMCSPKITRSSAAVPVLDAALVPGRRSAGAGDSLATGLALDRHAGHRADAVRRRGADLARVLHDAVHDARHGDDLLRDHSRSWPARSATT